MSALEENETLEYLELKENNFSVQGYLALASSLPNIKGLREIDFSWTASDPSVMPALLKGFERILAYMRSIFKGVRMANGRRN
jgi:Ran GTPase-activating protein (RanGAP) involved in mRNA processing and transport